MHPNSLRVALLIFVLGLSLSCSERSIDQRSAPTRSTVSTETAEKPVLHEIGSEPVRMILESLREQIRTTTQYTQQYYVIPYPNGDVPAETGACTDVIIRALRRAGVDLQKEVHEDMRVNFTSYPRKWGLERPDTNIDHRRVPNLQAYLTRKGKSLAVSNDPQSYKPGDVVSWDLDDRGTTHIGVVSNIWNERTGRYLVVHNIGGGTKAEDRLFEWQITGHYRYFQ